MIFGIIPKAELENFLNIIVASVIAILGVTKPHRSIADGSDVGHRGFDRNLDALKCIEQQHP
jgi:hypothetical protein